MKQQKYILALLCLAAVLMPACLISGAATPEVKVTETPAYTSTPANTPTTEPTATQTPRPSATPRPSPTPNLEATKQYEDMAAKVGEYHKAGFVSTEKGTYKRLKTYLDSWAQIGWYQWSPIGRSAPDNFIIRSKVAWQSASKSPDPSGCGYVFRLQENGDHYMVFVSLDGNVYASIVSSGNFNNMGRGHYGKAVTDGSAIVTLIVEGPSFSVLVDDQLIKRFEGRKNDMLSGNLAYTIVSGTNKDYGTRCVFENTDLWTIEK